MPDAERQSDSEYDVARDLFLVDTIPAALCARAESGRAERAKRRSQSLRRRSSTFRSARPRQLDCRLPEAEHAARRAVQAQGRFPRGAEHAGRHPHPREKVRRSHRRAESRSPTTFSTSRPGTHGATSVSPTSRRARSTTPSWPSAKRRGRAALLRRKLSSRARLRKKGRLVAAREALSRAVETNHPRMSGAAGRVRSASARVFQDRRIVILPRGTWKRCKEISAESPAGQRCAASLKSSPC